MSLQKENKNYKEKLKGNFRGKR